MKRVASSKTANIKIRCKNYTPNKQIKYLLLMWWYKVDEEIKIEKIKHCADWVAR